MQKEPSPVSLGTRFEIRHKGFALDCGELDDGSVQLYLQRKDEAGRFIATFKDELAVTQFLEFLLSLKPQFVRDWDVRLD